jgi:hypothetical protein
MKMFWRTRLIVGFCFLGCFCSNNSLAQEKIQLSHSALETSNSVWFIPKEKGFYKKMD